MGDKGTDLRTIILKWLSNTQNTRVWTKFDWLWEGIIGEFLYTK